MSAGMPELGSKISLISKADIRYEGRLFTVDPQECTIALSNVRSFGTEDRDASFPVAPQSQIYDYILFRGSDIKDIRVVHNVNPIPNDPAIVTLSVPPPMASSGFQAQQQQQQQQQSMQAPSHPAPGAFSHSQFGGYGGAGMGGLPGSGLSLGMDSVASRMSQEARALSSELVDTGLDQHPVQQQSHPPQQQQQQQKQQQQQQTPQQKPPSHSEPADLISRRSSSTTPPRKSPTMDQGTQAGTPGAVGSTPQRQRGRGGSSGGQMMSRERNDQPQQQQHDQRNNRSSRQQQQQQGGWQSSAWQHQGQQMRQQQQQDGWGSQSNRGAWQNGPRRGRGRGGSFQRPPGMMGQPQGNARGPQQQVGQSSQQQQGQQGQKKNVLKFEGDYDFEQANTEFENLRAQLANIKLTATAAGQLPNSTAEVTPTSAVTSTKVNGEDKKEVDSGNETGVGEGEAEEESEVYYDKTKSFFDNISCEAIERSKGCSQRTDWRQERKLNSETFGVASARRGYRGRGGYYRGGMYRGSGYRGSGYRGGNRGSFNRYPGQQMQQPDMRMGQQPGGQNRATAAAGGK